MKRYFVKLCDHCDLQDPLYLITREVIREEYIMLANTEVRAATSADLERIMEGATKHAGVCGTRHLFWTEDYVFPEFLIVSHDAETVLELRLSADSIEKATGMAETLKNLSKDEGMVGWSAEPGFEISIYKKVLPC